MSRPWGDWINRSEQLIAEVFGLYEQFGASDWLVEYHVQAERYLTLKEPGYYDRHSEASRRTLEYQGGVMTVEEAEAFEQDPLCAISLRMRHWDEQAKDMGVPVMDLQVLKEKAGRLLAV